MNTVTVESVIGLRHWPDQFNESFSFINGYIRSPKPVIRHGIGSLGNFQPHDIGKRVHRGQVENDEQITRRTGLTLEERRTRGENIIKNARIKYKGHKNIWGLTI
jgi:hypothetical protein